MTSVSDVSTVSKDRTRLETPKPKPAPRWAVVLFNDDVHSFSFVIATLCKVIRCSSAESQRLTLKIHREGQAIVWTGSREVAELKRDQLRATGPDFYSRPPVHVPLTVEIQPME